MDTGKVRIEDKYQFSQSHKAIKKNITLKKNIYSSVTLSVCNFVRGVTNTLWKVSVDEIN